MLNYDIYKIMEKPITIHSKEDLEKYKELLQKIKIWVLFKTIYG